MTLAIIVHGGASPVPAEDAAAYKRGCLAAAQAGWAVLEQGGNACDAVEAAIRVLEEDETFNAGHGAALNADGVVEMDAAIMEGRELRFGALAVAQRLRHPISTARQILAVGPLLLSGEGVTRFAEAHVAELCEPEALITDKARQQWQQTEEQLREQRSAEPGAKDTVGCVALDADGLIAAGTSTGGEDHAPPGRIGDSALVGCGFYADNALGGCAVTGTGEAIMQVVLAKTAVELLAAGLHPDEAAQQAIELLGERVQGEGGCILLDSQGRVGWAHNSSHMPCAAMTSALDAPQFWLKRTEAGLPTPGASGSAAGAGRFDDEP
jgi:L-asparaginase / beta-aspartyl-peptidase